MHTFFRLFNFFEKKKKENFQKFSLQKTQFLTYIILKSIESMENPLRIQASYPWFSLCPEFIFSSCSLARFVYRSRVGQAKEAERFKWTRNQASWKGDVRMENLEWTEISAARDNRRRQYFNRRQIYRPREMANASNVPFCRSYPLLLPSNGWRDSKEQAHFTRRNNSRTWHPLSLSFRRLIRDQSTVEEAWSDKKRKKKWPNTKEYFVGRV